MLLLVFNFLTDLSKRATHFCLHFQVEAYAPQKLDAAELLEGLLPSNQKFNVRSSYDPAEFGTTPKKEVGGLQYRGDAH
jgi:hypothetical protein